jgi:hypothetical protein
MGDHLYRPVHGTVYGLPRRMLIREIPVGWVMGPDSTDRH